MGSWEVRAAVVDAGPIIHLNEIRCLSLLNVFETLHVPGTVWSETVESGRVPQREISKVEHVERRDLAEADVAQFIQKHRLDFLHRGERECLFLCRQMGIPILLTDDMAVRKAAKSVATIPVGSLGVIATACRMRIVSTSEAERYITSLYEASSLFVTRRIVDVAIDQLHRYFSE